jgi:hypothetical protein
MPQMPTLNAGRASLLPAKRLVPNTYGSHGGTRPLSERRAGSKSACWLEVFGSPYQGSRWHMWRSGTLSRGSRRHIWWSRTHLHGSGLHTWGFGSHLQGSRLNVVMGDGYPLGPHTWKRARGHLAGFLLGRPAVDRSKVTRQSKPILNQQRPMTELGATRA